MLHLAAAGKTPVAGFLDRVLARGVKFDVIGQSYYPKWHGTLDELLANLTDLAQRYDHPVIVVEYTAPDIRQINQIVADRPKRKGLGTFIWEPTRWGPGGPALFDRQGRTKPEIDVYPQIGKQSRTAEP